jgi:hypothetical protein
MVNMKKTPSFWILISLAMMVSSLAYGQVATPSLDTSLREDLAAATGWRYSSTVAASASAGTWDEIYRGEESEVGKGEVTYLLASHIYGPLYSEAFNAAVRKESKNVQEYSLYYQNIRSQVNFSFRIWDDSLCLGGHYSSSTIKQADETPIDQIASVDERIGIGLGASKRFGDWLFVAHGQESVSEESDTKVANNWQNLRYAIAIRDGFDDDSSYRIEYSRYTSEESFKEASDGSFKNSHFAVNSSKLSAEYMSDILIRIVFRYEIEHSVEGVEADQNLVSEVSTFGITWKPPKSWIIGLERINSKEKVTFSDSSLDYEKAETESYRLKLGYNFGGGA